MFSFDVGDIVFSVKACVMDSRDLYVRVLEFFWKVAVVSPTNDLKVAVVLDVHCGDRSVFKADHFPHVTDRNLQKLCHNELNGQHMASNRNALSALAVDNVNDTANRALLNLRECLAALHVEKVGLLFPKLDLAGPLCLDLLAVEGLPTAAMDLFKVIVWNDLDVAALSI